MASKVLRICTVLFLLQSLTACSAWGVGERPSRTSNSKLTQIVTPTKAPATPNSPKVSKKYPKATKKVYLTFDDGPGVYTPKIINILKQYNAKATFFDIGINAKRYPQYEKLVVSQGMGIGNHSYKHDDYRKYRNSYVNNDLKKTSMIIKNNIGRAPTCMRPPYGSTNYRINKIIGGNGMRVELWNEDSRDWSRPGVNNIINNSLRNIKGGDIILMHAGGGNRSQTVAALPKIIDTLKMRGYSLEVLESCK